MDYFVIKDRDTGLYYRGKGINKWGKYYNQASIYRIKNMAKSIAKEENLRGANCEVISIRIIELN